MPALLEADVDAAIVVAYDGSTYADEALAWASRTAAQEGRSVRAVAVLNAAGDPPEDLDNGVMARVTMATGVSGTLEQVKGGVISVLLQRSADAHVLVSGTRGRGRAAETVLGSVSQELARHTSCPLVVVRTPANPTATRIIAGVDGSDESIAALEFACHRASFTGESVVALHAWNPGHLALDYSGELPARIGRRSQAAVRLANECIAKVRDEFPEVSIEPDTVALAPTVALTEASTNASLVVTGSRGLGMLTGFLLGSVSQHLLTHAHCPVAVTR
jgi:nucleotide-binding universal stress UspA family protein